jgi:hypothetical protein
MTRRQTKLKYPNDEWRDIYDICHIYTLSKLKKFLDDPYIDPSVQQNHMIRYYVGHGKIKYVELLLKYDSIDPSVDNNRLVKDCFSDISKGYPNLQTIGNMLLEDRRVYNKLKKYKDDLYKRSPLYRKDKIKKALKYVR